MKTFVLIPGAGGSSWYWSRVAPLLRAAGHEVLAVELPGPDANAGLSEYAQLVGQAIGGRPPVTLVAQSLGGFVAPLVCDRTRVDALVLVNAMIPVPGETPGEWGEHTGSTEARLAAARRGGYSADFDDETYFFHDLDPEVVEEGRAYEQPEAETVFTSRCDFTLWPDIPIRVLVGADDRLFPADFQRAVARTRLGVEPDLLPGGHLIALSQPEAVASYLLRG